MTTRRTGLSETSASSFTCKLVDRGVAQLVVTVSTPKPRRSVTALGVEFRFIRCRRKHFFGVTEHWVSKQGKVHGSPGTDDYRWAQTARALRRNHRGRQGPLDATARRERQRLVQYARRIGVGAVVRRLGFLLETYEMAGTPDLSRLLNGLTATYVRLDPVLSAEGKRLRRWRLRLNVDPEELRAVVRT